jgi:hypothetical protein
LKCVLSEKARQDRLVCVNSMDTIDGKTKSMVSLLENLEIKGSALIVTKDSDESVVRAAHNLQKIWTLPVALVNAHELLRRDTVIMTLDAARWAEEFLAGEPRRGRGAVLDGDGEEAQDLPEQPTAEDEALPSDEAPQAAALEPADEPEAAPDTEATGALDSPDSGDEPEEADASPGREEE